MVDFGHDIKVILANTDPRLSLDRRNRVAVEAALECLRFRWGGTWRVTEEDADTCLVDAHDALVTVGTECVQRFTEALPRERRARGHIVGNTRLLRARLALVLRAVLRAAGAVRYPFPLGVGPLGPVWLCRCTSRGATGGAKGIRACEPCSWCGATPPAGAARIRPLWEFAGPHVEASS